MITVEIETDLRLYIRIKAFKDDIDNKLREMAILEAFDKELDFSKAEYEVTPIGRIGCCMKGARVKLFVPFLESEYINKTSNKTKNKL